MNKLILMGRLVADPEFSVSQSNVAVCKFRIAVDRSYTKQGEEKQSDFLYIVSFGKTAEFVSKFFVKGKPIIVEGRIQNNNYQDQNGVMQYHNQIIADTVNFVLSDPTRTSSGSSAPVQHNQQNQYNNGYQANQPVQSYQQPVQQGDFAGYENISGGNMPF